MPQRHPAVPKIWLISDARNDAQLEQVLAKLPRGSGLIYRHYHLSAGERRARFDRLDALARRRGHVVILSGTPREARRWRADGSYGSPAKAGASGLGCSLCNRLRSPPSRGRNLRLVTAHSLAEIAMARRARADMILLSPVFATRSHPGARTLGPLRFRLLAARAGVPVIALGGMDAARRCRIGCTPWAAIDGLIPKDS